MNELVKKIKIFLCGAGSAIAAFLLFLLCRNKSNNKSDTGIKSDIERIQDTATDIRTTTERFADANRRLEKLIAEIETKGN